MNVQTLINYLNEVDPELEVVLSRDEEGNGFKLWDGASRGWFDGEEYYNEDEIDVEEDGPAYPVICLWP